MCRSEVPHVSHGSRAAGVILAAADSAGVSSSQDDRPYEIGEFNVLDYSEHSAFDGRVTQWQLILDLFAQDVPVTYEMLRNEDVPCPRQLARNRATLRAPLAAADDDDDDSSDSRPTLPPPSYDGDSQLTRTIWGKMENRRFSIF